MSRLPILSRLLPAAFAVAALAACSADPITTPGSGNGGSGQPAPQPRVVASVSVAPTDPAPVDRGLQRYLRATVRATDGTTLTDRTIAWSLSDSTLATIDFFGTLTARKAGTVVVRATVDGKVGETSIEIREPTVKEVAVSPRELRLLSGDSATVAAYVLGTNGEPLYGRPVAWASKNESVVRVDAEGRLVALGAGQTWIVATVDGKQGWQSVTVELPKYAGMWRMKIHNVVGANALCQLTNLELVLYQDGARFTGEGGSYNGGPLVECTPMAEGPVSTPVAPTGFATVSLELGVNFTVRFHSQGSWVLTGTYARGYITGTAVYTEWVNGAKVERRGTFVARRVEL